MQSRFHDCPLIRINEMPDVSAEFTKSAEKPMGGLA
jgi:hypothetical protein